MRRAGGAAAPGKSCALVALTLVTWAGLCLLSWRSFVPTIPASYGPAAAFALKLVHAPWALFWLWAVHNFWHHTLSLWPRRRRAPRPTGATRRHAVAVLYTTCDDFDAEACRSCLEQDHPRARLVICDDSADEHNRRLIDAWAAARGPRVSVVRRRDRRGFKAGNLNHAIDNFVREEFFVVCDADELLPPDFVSRLLPYFGRRGPVGFVQARHRLRTPAPTSFSALLGPTVNIFYDYCLPLRNRFGFVSCFGHGVMIRRSVWRAAGGFPEIVSEDIGFAARALARGFRGVYAEEVVAAEAYPASYTAFLSKYCRIIGGTIEFFREEAGPLLRSRRAAATEKLDLLLTFSSCYIGVVAAVNLVCGVLLSYLYSLHGYRRVECWLLALYLVGPLTPVVPLMIHLARQPRRYGRYVLTAGVAYASIVPLLAFKGVEQTLRLRRPVFEPTGKVSRRGQRLGDHAFTHAAGALVLVAALALRSPIFVPTVGVALMFLTGPLMCFAERPGCVGALARHCGVIPYASMLILLLASW